MMKNGISADNNIKRSSLRKSSSSKRRVGVDVKPVFVEPTLPSVSTYGTVNQLLANGQTSGIEIGRHGTIRKRRSNENTVANETIVLTQSRSNVDLTNQPKIKRRKTKTKKSKSKQKKSFFCFGKRSSVSRKSSLTRRTSIARRTSVSRKNSVARRTTINNKRRRSIRHKPTITYKYKNKSQLNNSFIPAKLLKINEFNNIQQGNEYNSIYPMDTIIKTGTTETFDTARSSIINPLSYIDNNEVIKSIIPDYLHYYDFKSDLNKLISRNPKLTKSNVLATIDSNKNIILQELDNDTSKIDKKLISNIILNNENELINDHEQFRKRIAQLHHDSLISNNNISNFKKNSNSIDRSSKRPLSNLEIINESASDYESSFKRNFTMSNKNKGYNYDQNFIDEPPIAFKVESDPQLVDLWNSYLRRVLANRIALRQKLAQQSSQDQIDYISIYTTTSSSSSSSNSGSNNSNYDYDEEDESIYSSNSIQPSIMSSNSNSNTSNGSISNDDVRHVSQLSILSPPLSPDLTSTTGQNQSKHYSKEEFKQLEQLQLESQIKELEPPIIFDNDINEIQTPLTPQSESEIEIVKEIHSNNDNSINSNIDLNHNKSIKSISSGEVQFHKQLSESLEKLENRLEAIDEPIIINIESDDENEQEHDNDDNENVILIGSPSPLPLSKSKSKSTLNSNSNELLSAPTDIERPMSVESRLIADEEIEFYKKHNIENILKPILESERIKRNSNSNSSSSLDEILPTKEEEEEEEIKTPLITKKSDKSNRNSNESSLSSGELLEKLTTNPTNPVVRLSSTPESLTRYGFPASEGTQEINRYSPGNHAGDRTSSIVPIPPISSRSSLTSNRRSLPPPPMQQLEPAWQPKPTETHRHSTGEISDNSISSSVRRQSHPSNYRSGPFIRQLSNSSDKTQSSVDSNESNTSKLSRGSPNRKRNRPLSVIQHIPSSSSSININDNEKLNLQLPPPPPKFSITSSSNFPKSISAMAIKASNKKNKLLSSTSFSSSHNLLNNEKIKRNFSFESYYSTSGDSMIYTLPTERIIRESQAPDIVEEVEMHENKPERNNNRGRYQHKK